MNKLIRYSALAAFIGTGVSGLAYADTASTTGGIKIKSDDGNFDASIGGRVHFDGVILSPDDSAYNGTTKNEYGSGSLNNASGFYFRRVFLTLGGHAYGWEYKVEDDLVGGQAGAAPTYSTTTTYTVDVTTGLPSGCKANSDGKTATCTATSTTSSTNNPVGGFQDVYIGHSLFSKNDELYIGQKKPWRSMSELQSNNEILFMERPVTSASGIFAGRDFQDGLSYRYYNKPTGLWVGGAVYSLSKIGQNSTEGTGENARIAWAPINKDGLVLHTGFSFSSDHADNGGSMKPSYNFGGYKLSTPVSATLASYAATTGGNVDANSWTGEFAGVFGPAFLEGEYAHQTIGGPSQKGSDLDAYYVQASVFVTGESKGYNATNAVIAGNPKPLHSYGAIELKVRYEDFQNQSVDAANAATGACSATSLNKSLTVDKCDVNDIAFGVNYYVNPNVRFMFDYVMATEDLGSAGKDKPDTIAARAQISF